MALTLHIDLGYEFVVHADPDTVFDTLADVPRSASFFPQVARLTDLGAQTYRWEMAKVGVGQFSVQTIYASRYQSDRNQGRVSWAPVHDAPSNAQVSGHWAIQNSHKGTALTLVLQGDLQLPLPALMKPVLSPLVSAEFEKLVERYIANLCEHFGGEVV